MRIAKPIERLVDSFQRLPGVGPKTAQRLAFYMLRLPQSHLDEFADALSELKKNTKLCSVCKNVAEHDPCPICSDENRDETILLVVEEPLDIIAFEKTGNYKGLYHVLHGAINPLDNIGPDELYMEDLVARLSNGTVFSEVIVATNPTMEGEATAMYLKKRLENISKIKLTRLGMGIPTGADLEYADEVTLKEALNGRKVI